MSFLVAGDGGMEKVAEKLTGGGKLPAVP